LDTVAPEATNRPVPIAPPMAIIRMWRPESLRLSWVLLPSFEAMTSSMLGPVSPAAEGVFSLMPRLLGLSGPFPALGALPLLGPPFSLP